MLYLKKTDISLKICFHFLRFDYSTSRFAQTAIWTVTQIQTSHHHHLFTLIWTGWCQTFKCEQWPISKTKTNCAASSTDAPLPPHHSSTPAEPSWWNLNGGDLLRYLLHSSGRDSRPCPSLAGCRPQGGRGMRTGCPPEWDWTLQSSPLHRHCQIPGWATKAG